jgi:hypothetical protein
MVRDAVAVLVLEAVVPHAIPGKPSIVVVAPPEQTGREIQDF